MRVLVPIDGSRHSAEAVDIAIDYAKAKTVEVFLLSVAPSTVDMDIALTDAQREEISAALLKGSEALLKETESYMEGHGITPQSILRVTANSVAEEILDFAEKEAIDLVVLGSRGLREYGRFPLGSVATEVVRYCPCSVFVVRLT